MLRLASAFATAIVLVATAAGAQRRASDAPDDPPVAYGPITYEQAKRVMAGAEAVATKNDWPAVIVILDSSGAVVMLHRLERADWRGIDVAMARARMVLELGVASRLEGGVGMSLVAGTRLVGAVGIAGVTTEQAAQVARAGIAALK